MKTSTLIVSAKKFFLGCILLTVCSILYAQKPIEKKTVEKKPVEKKTVALKPIEKKSVEIDNRWSININGGSTQYWGYINSRNFGTTLKHTPTFGYGLVLSRRISPVFSIRGQFLMGQLKGRKDQYSDSTYANLRYSSNFIEGNIMAKVSFTDLIKGYKPNRMFSFYGLVGLGFSNFEGVTTSSITGDTITKFGFGSGKGINGYELDGMATIGVGMTVKINQNLDFTFENAMKFIQTNKLNERNGTLKADLYGYSSIGLSYNFGFKKASKNVPVVKNDIIDKQKPVTTEKKPEVKKEEAPVPVKTEVKKEVAVPAPVKTEPKVIPAEPLKPTQPVKPVENVVMFTGYKIQIIATLSPASFDNIMLDYKLKEQIREDHTDKWYRYSIGEFKTYREAYNYRKILNSRNKIKGSFIVKFANGKRIGPVWK